MKVIILALCLWMATFSRAGAETMPDENAVSGMLKKTMAKVMAGDLLTAFAIIKPFMPVTSAEFDSIALQYKSVIERYTAKYGNPTAVEFIDTKKVGDSLLRIRYMEKNDKYAHIWVFYFYKTKDGWLLNSFNWEDSVKNLF